MAGLYIHIPFCRQVCRYCDFHFSVNTAKAAAMVEAICLEILLRRDYLTSHRFDTVYFGGGTPSLLDENRLKQVVDTLYRELPINASCEFTLEANPDDLDGQRLKFYRALGINRLSIGVQSFSNPVLMFLNRSHCAKTAMKSLSLARKAHFDNISVDLMYAIPGQGNDACMVSVEKALHYSPEHIAVYALTLEERTVFGHWRSRRKIASVDDRDSAMQFERIAHRLGQAGYQHYEVASFCKPGFQAVHNSNYWQQVPYMGVGPGAHSFDGASRQWNIRNNSLYIKAIRQHETPYEKEVLSIQDHINEYILTSLRTSQGCDLGRLKAAYGVELGTLHKNYLHVLRTQGMAILDGDRLILTQKGRLLADAISAKLFVDQAV